ncbi:hypothetical protein PF004_g13917 [Phytophthora fragariae]|uniref:Uncharacterized protein n=1 Tax=Phytophthora fragariae TaxID=53985 RepID=A0A6G0NQW4_9STRA|nr:hypothetical protein PF004_g13917 [Phytophthora fragariae]KAE9333627.1 hypothetical protein PF008_g14358 [Phytophthora fragariae]
MAAPPPLSSAHVVCCAQPRLAPLKHVTAAVSSFLDYSARWSIESACARAGGADGVSLRLLERIAAHRAAADSQSFRAKRQLDVFHRQWEFTRAAAAAATRGDLAAFKWLVAMFPECRVTVAVEEAAKAGQLHVLQWLLDKSRRRELTVFWGAKELFFAGKHGHLHVAQWLHEHTSPPPTHMFFVTLEEAARNGDLDMVTWLCDVRGEWSPYAACERAEGCSAKAFVNATASGELEILKWLFANHRERLGRDRLRIYALGKFYILQWLKMEAGADEREAFMGEVNALAQG